MINEVHSSFLKPLQWEGRGTDDRAGEDICGNMGGGLDLTDRPAEMGPPSSAEKISLPGWSRVAGNGLTNHDLYIPSCALHPPAMCLKRYQWRKASNLCTLEENKLGSPNGITGRAFRNRSSLSAIRGAQKWAVSSGLFRMALEVWCYPTPWDGVYVSRCIMCIRRLDYVQGSIFRACLHR